MLPVGVLLLALHTTEVRLGVQLAAIPQAAVVEESEPPRVVEGEGVFDDQFGSIPQGSRFGLIKNVV